MKLLNMNEASSQNNKLTPHYQLQGLPTKSLSCFLIGKKLGLSFSLTKCSDSRMKIQQTDQPTDRQNKLHFQTVYHGMSQYIQCLH